MHNTLVTYDAVHIEDDIYLRLHWEHAAKKENLKLLSLERPQDLRHFKNHISKDTPIYIDHRFGEIPDGLDWARKWKAQGYKNVFLSTGHTEYELGPLFGIQLVDKFPPWASPLSVIR